MGWRTHVFGSEKLTATKVIAVSVVFLVLAALFYSLWIDFESEPWVARNAMWYAGVLGSVVACWMTWLIVTGRNKAALMSPTVAVLMTPVYALIAAFMLWYPISDGIPGAYTRLFGRPTVKVVVFETEELRGGKGCRYRARTHLDDHVGAFILCVGADYYRAHPDRRVELALIGYRSDYGLYVVDSRHVRDLGRRLR